MNVDQLSQQLKNFSETVVDRVMVMRVANLGLLIIWERTLSGKFLEGSSAGAEEYSTKPFARPLAGILKQHRKALLENGSVIFTNEKDGKQLWIIIKGGYKEYRSLAGKDISKVSLTWSERMMRNLGILNADDASAILGPKDEDTRKLSLYHNVLGAGKSKRLHKFMGFTDNENERLRNEVAEEVMKRLKLQ